MSSVRGRFFILENYWVEDIPLDEAYYESNKYKWIDGMELSVKDYIRYLESYGLGDDIENYGERVVGWSGETPVYVYKCSICFKEEYATLNTINRRGGLYCKSCSMLKTSIERNGSLEEKMPELKPYYSPSNTMKMCYVPYVKSSRNYVGMICSKCGEEYSSRVDYIIKDGVALCSLCKRRKGLVEKSGSLRDFSSRVADMYDKGNNGTLASDVPPYSDIKARFRCDSEGKEHYFIKAISSMTATVRTGTKGCPVCAGFQVYRGINDFASKMSETAEMWDYDRNEGVSPDEVSYRSIEEYWFVCPEGHNFRRSPEDIRRHFDTNRYKGCTVCSGKQIQEGINDLITLYPEIIDYWDWDRNTIDPYTIGVSNRLAWFFCRDCEDSFEYRIDYWTNTMGRCENCRKRKGYSKAEKEVVAYIQSKGFTVEENKRFGHFELDAFIPELNIAFEYNGLYYHSTVRHEDKFYHYNKHKACEELGIKLYFIWEDDYDTKRDVVLSFVDNKLGISDARKLNARDLEITTSVGVDEARSFCNRNHIQGFCSGGYYVGLRDSKGKLVSLGIFKQIDCDLRLERYCTEGNVRGGFSKIMSEVSKWDFLGVYTFSDNCVSDGGLYADNGFELIEELDPDYSYLYGGRRVHKFNFRKSRFERDATLEYKEGLTERQLAELNDIPRVYDAGKKKWYFRF